jgi:hypothetical protein
MNTFLTIWARTPLFLIDHDVTELFESKPARILIEADQSLRKASR